MYNKLDVIFGYDQYNGIDTKPENWDELLAVADILSEDFDYVRVDLYDYYGKIYFGELTFCHGGGGNRICPREFDVFLGDLWKKYFC